jgi:hypothetical protein
MLVGLAALLGLGLFVYGILDKYVFHPHLDVHWPLTLRTLMGFMFMVGFLMVMLSLYIPALHGARKAGRQAAAAVPKQFVTRDGRYAVELPGTWEQNATLAEADSAALLAASDLHEDLHLMLFAERKADLIDMTLEKYAQLTMQRFSQGDGKVDVVRWEKTSLGSWAGLEYEVEVANGNFRVTMLIATFETPEDYCQIRVIGIRSRVFEHRAMLKDALASLRRIPSQPTETNTQFRPHCSQSPFRRRLAGPVASALAQFPAAVTGGKAVSHIDSYR